MTQNESLEARLATIEDLLRQVLAREAIPKRSPNLPPGSPYHDPLIYGDFGWLLQTCPGIPASTLRKKSALGLIPGYRKIGNRVIYNRQQVIDWIEGQQKS